MGRCSRAMCDPSRRAPPWCFAQALMVDVCENMLQRWKSWQATSSGYAILCHVGMRAIVFVFGCALCGVAQSRSAAAVGLAWLRIRRPIRIARLLAEPRAESLCSAWDRAACWASGDSGPRGPQLRHGVGSLDTGYQSGGICFSSALGVNRRIVSGWLGK